MSAIMLIVKEVSNGEEVNSDIKHSHHGKQSNYEFEAIFHNNILYNFNRLSSYSSHISDKNSNVCRRRYENNYNSRERS
jgi:hypothetical protein